MAVRQQYRSRSNVSNGSRLCGRDFVDEAEAVGAVHEPLGTGIDPAKLAFGYPRIFRPDPQQNLFYALGYGENGVSYSAQAGKRMVQMIAGQTFKGQDLPIFNAPLPGHPFGPFRRIGQRMLYRWYHLRDEAA